MMYIENEPFCNVTEPGPLICSGVANAGQSHECCFLYWGSVALVHQLSALPMAFSSEADPSPALTEYFADLDDTRRENGTDYPLHEIIVCTRSSL